MVQFGKKFLRSSNEIFIFDEHDVDLHRFMSKYIDWDSYNDFIDLVYEHIAEFKIILLDWISSMNKKIEYIVDSFSKGYRLMLVSGARDSGKTCFGFWFIEQIHKKYPNTKKFAYVGVKLKKRLLPEWCENLSIENYQELVDKDLLFNYVVILDEMAIHFNARKWQSAENIKFSQLIAISRHKHLSVIAIAQDFSMVETNAWKMRDMVVYKKSNTYELNDRDTRTKGSSSNKIVSFWKYVKQWMHPKKKNEALFEYQSERRLMLIEHPTPTFWSQELSEGFSNFNIFEKKGEPISITPKVKKKKISDIDEY